MKPDFNLKDFADSIGAKLVLPAKPLLDKERDCTNYRHTDVAQTFEKVRKASGVSAAAPPFQMSAAGAEMLDCIEKGLGIFGPDRVKPTRPGLRRAK